MVSLLACEGMQAVSRTVVYDLADCTSNYTTMLDI